jgi:hypothetical protein
MASALLSGCSMRVSAAIAAPSPPRSLVSCTSIPALSVAAPQVRTREISCVPVSAETHVSRRDAIVAGGSTMLAGFLLLLPSDDAEARTKNPEVTKKLKEAIEKVKVKANQSFEGAKGAAKQAKASVKAAVAKK